MQGFIISYIIKILDHTLCMSRLLIERKVRNECIDAEFFETHALLHSPEKRIIMIMLG